MNLIEYFKKHFPHTSSFASGLSLFIVDAIVLFLCIGAGFFIVNLFDMGHRNHRFTAFRYRRFFKESSLSICAGSNVVNNRQLLISHFNS